MEPVFTKGDLPGVWIYQLHVRCDSRGAFIKTFHFETFRQRGLETNFFEAFFSTSMKDVIRGMHFQTPPFHCDKIISVYNGSIVDVLLDLRRFEDESIQTYGKTMAVTLSAQNGKSIYVPAGVAHGFLALEENTIVGYQQSQMYHPDADTCLRFDSINFNWPQSAHIVSERDNRGISFEKFNSPFVSWPSPKGLRQ